MREQDTGDHVELNRQYWDEAAAAVHGPLARGPCKPSSASLWCDAYRWIPESACRDYPEVAAAWARRWPCEGIWKARLTATLA
jgi:hypothetical protein